ncbi:MAG TPA: PrsW family glutamic-type intramembrane protease [Propionibacteriaceae bacterium]|nr:PrsW family glutamic-type intramembrane protease [Propionibacteriaceae bacterium]
MADALRTDLPGIGRYRRLSAVDVPDARLTTVERFTRSRWLWASVVVLLLGVFALVRLRLILTADVKTDAGTVPGLNTDALTQAASYAFPTLLVWSLLFLVVDRWRPQRWLLWALALFWGGSIAAYGSLVVNSWAAQRLAIDQNGNQLAGARAAVYIAPFVEELFKATVLFLVAFLDRRRLTSILSLVSLAGLSAIGFAFSENIVYYARAIVYGSMTASTGDVAAAVAQLVTMRGFWTSFGHPLFTSMTAVGLAIGLRSRAKVVRVVGPVAGYLTAALLHMTFNTVAGLFPDSAQKMVYLTLALPVLFSVVVFVGVQVVREGRLIRNRLSDYVMAGWMPDTYPLLFSRVLQRARMLALSPWWGNVLATYRLQRAVTELAYLRDQITRGTVDAAGLWRERELLDEIRALRAAGGLDDARGLRPYWRRRATYATGWQPPSYPGPAGIGGQFPAAALGSPVQGPAVAGPQFPAPVPVQAPLGSGQSSSVVDPRWGPPRV